MKYRVTFDRIGRHYLVAPLIVDIPIDDVIDDRFSANTKIIQKRVGLVGEIIAYATNYLLSNDVRIVLNTDVDFDPNANGQGRWSGEIIYSGHHSAGRFTVEDVLS